MIKRLSVLLICSGLWSPVFSQQKTPPSIIIIMADQLRYDVVGDMTPNINSLRAEGITFNRAYCASPICVPSRGSFFTGLYPNRTGSLINGWTSAEESFGLVKKGTPNLYTIMEKTWDSWHVGKQHFFTEEKIDELPGTKTKWITQKDYNARMNEKGVAKPGGKDFRAMVPEMISGLHTYTRNYSIPTTRLYKGGLENFIDRYIGNESVAAIRNRERGKPLLLNAMFLAPHPPFHIPDPYFSIVSDDEVKLPTNVGVWSAGQSPLQLYNITGFLGSRYTRAEWQSIWAKYLGLVKLLDDEVGRIIQALKDEGLYDNSLIVFTADHGEMLGSHSLWQKMCMYEESARVPLIIKFPRGFRHAINETNVPVSLVDVLPTVLEYTGKPVPEGLDGRSLLPMVLSTDIERRPVFIQYDGNASLGNFQRCIVDGDFKLIVDIFKDEMFLELYDTKSDPQEAVNLAFSKEYKTRTGVLLRELSAYMQQTGDRLAIPADIYERFLSTYKNSIQE